MDVLAVRPDVAFAPRPNTVVLLAGAMIPPPDSVPVTSACAVVCDGAGDVLLTHVTGRGYDLPGGHLEAGETPLDACLREITEETGLSVDPVAVPGQEPMATVLVEIAAPRPVDYGYPHPRSQMWIYRAAVPGRRPAVRPVESAECTHARWFDPRTTAELCARRCWAPAFELARALSVDEPDGSRRPDVLTDVGGGVPRLARP